MKKIGLLVVMCLVTAYAFSQSAMVKTLNHEGAERDYRLYVPLTYNGTQAVPLLINMHGYGSNAWEQENYADFRLIADTANFILVAPQAVPNDNGELAWNANNLTQTNDVDFISKLIDTIASEYNINLNRVYATGMSNGGFMAYKLACELSNRVTAVASVAGSMDVFLTSTCQPSHPTPVMQIHGTADAIVLYDGVAFVNSVDALVAHWVNFNQCATTPDVTEIPNIVSTDGSTATRFVYSGGNNGVAVELIKVTGGGHSWPGAPLNINVTNMDFSASAEIWRFFSAYELPQLLNTNSLSRITPSFDVFPNPSRGPIALRFSVASSRRITVCDALGRNVFETKTAGPVTHVELSQPGFYLITVVEGTSVTTRHAIIE